MTTTRAISLPVRRKPQPINIRNLAITSSALLFALLAWQLLVTVLSVPEFILPAPLTILMGADWGTAFAAAARTVLSTLLGFAVGNLVGYVLALLVSASATLSTVLTPGAIVVRSIPVVALAPFITLAFGRGTAATVVVAAMIVFFPTFVNVLQGLTSVSAESVELMRVLNATVPQQYLRLRIPASMPSFFGALRIAAPNAVLGVMTAEWIVGGGLGHLVITSWLALNMTTMWAAVVLSAVLASLIFSLVTILERVVAGWARTS